MQREEGRGPFGRQTKNSAGGSDRRQRQPAAAALARVALAWQASVYLVG